MDEGQEFPEVPEDADGRLPLLPGFREMALRRMSEQRRGLVTELAERRRAAGMSQTEVAARMGTSQSAVARLEAGEADVRASTLERYAAAVGAEVSWQLGALKPDRPQFGPGQFDARLFDARAPHAQAPDAQAPHAREHDTPPYGTPRAGEPPQGG